MQLGGVDLGLIALDHAIKLIHRGYLGVQLLFGDGVLRQQNFVAFEIDLGVFEHSFVFRHLPLCQGELYLKRTRIDLSQQIPLADDLPFLERHLD